MKKPNLPKVLDSSGQEVRRLHPIRVQITENIIPLSTATMDIMAEDVVPERTYIELFNANGSAGVYRTRAPEISYGGDRNSISLEHGVCEIGDWLVRAEIEQTEMTLAAAMQRIFAFYGGSRWQLGTVQASGNVILSCRYANLLQTINGLIEQVDGAMLTYDFSTTPWTLGVKLKDSTVSAEGRLSRNVISASVKKDDSQLYTRVWLEGLPGGYMDADTVSLYGIIETKLSDREYTQTQAQIVASSYLARHKKPIYTITIDAQEFFAITGETLDRTAIGAMYRLAIPAHGVVIDENIISRTWNDVYGDPMNVTLTLSQGNETIVDFIQRQNAETNGAGGSAEYSEVVKIKQETALAAEKERAQGAEYELSHSIEETDESLTVLYQKTGVNSLGQQETLYSRITQNAESISAEVTRATESEGTLSGRIDVTASAVTAEVTRATAAEGELSGRISVNADNITAEVTRASAAEGTLSGRISVNADNITAEVTRAQGAESTLSGRISVNADNITAEVTRAQGAESALSGRISVNADNITAEVTRAKGAEGDLSGRISVNADNITAEVTRAQGAESTLSGRISVNADNITAEVTRATTAEGELSGRISVNAESITAEVTRAQGAENALSASITTTAESIQAWVTNNYYGVKSGISIEANGIEISGSKYLKLVSGGYIDVASSNFSVDQNGTVTAKKFISVDENGRPTEINLSSQPLWRLSQTVKTLTNTGGAVTIELYNGTSINFNTADSVDLSSVYSLTATSTFGVGTAYTLEFSGLLTNGKLISVSETFNATEAADAGWNNCRNAAVPVQRYTLNDSTTGTVTHYDANGRSIGAGWFHVTRADAYTLPDPK